MKVDMQRNVEIKARVKDLDKLRKIAEGMGSPGTLLEQRDVFFKSPQGGRLKLRNIKGSTAQLIFYDRPDTAGPKCSSFHVSQVQEPEVLEVILTKSNGVRGIVSKTRQLFLIGQTRLHLDQVEGLGSFMELEVCLSPEQTVEDGQAIAEDLMQKLEVAKEDLLQGAYMDMLLKRDESQ